MRTRVAILLLALWGTLGCASRAVQTEAVIRQPPPVPEYYTVEGVPFIEQDTGHCGPATLAMAMQWGGRYITADDLASQVYTPVMKGSLQQDMITATRRNGMIAIPVKGFHNLLQEISAGHPVIVFENLAFDWMPRWHYAIVFGYNLRTRQVLMHSGPEAFKLWDMDVFERSWMLGDYWGMVVLPSHKLSFTGSELAHAGAAAGLEQTKNYRAAQEAYTAMLERWPTSLTAYIGLANIAYEKRNYEKAVALLRKATELHPNSASAWHNLTIALGALEKGDEAQASATQAIRHAPKESKDTYTENLKQWVAGDL